MDNIRRCLGPDYLQNRYDKRRHTCASTRSIRRLCRRTGVGRHGALDFQLLSAGHYPPDRSRHRGDAASTRCAGRQTAWPGTRRDSVMEQLRRRRPCGSGLSTSSRNRAGALVLHTAGAYSCAGPPATRVGLGWRLPVASGLRSQWVADENFSIRCQQRRLSGHRLLGLELRLWIACCGISRGLDHRSNEHWQCGPCDRQCALCSGDGVPSSRTRGFSGHAGRV